MKIPPSAIVISSLLLGLATSGRSESPNRYAPLTYRPMGNYGQALVDMEMAKHPELRLMVIHTTPLGVPVDSDKDRMILCSSIGRIGKHTGKTDIKTFHTGQGSLEWEKGPDPRDPVPLWAPQSPPKYGMIEQLRVKSGESVGLIFIIFHWAEGDDVTKNRKIADEILAEFKERVETKDDLLKPAPWP